MVEAIQVLYQNGCTVEQAKEAHPDVHFYELNSARARNIRKGWKVPPLGEKTIETRKRRAAAQKKRVLQQSRTERPSRSSKKRKVLKNGEIVTIVKLNLRTVQTTLELRGAPDDVINDIMTLENLLSKN